MAIVHIRGRSQGLFERIAYGVLGLVLLVFGFFFLAVALAAGAVLVSIALIRFWWRGRNLRKAADEIITAEYSVVERETLPRPPAAGPGPGPGRD